MHLNRADKVWLTTFAVFQTVWIGLPLISPPHIGENDHWTVFVFYAVNWLLLAASAVCLRKTSFGEFIKKQRRDIQIFCWGYILLLHIATLVAPFVTAVIIGSMVYALKESNITNLVNIINTWLFLIVLIATPIALLIATGWLLVNLKRSVRLCLSVLCPCPQTPLAQPCFVLTRTAAWWAIALAGLGIIYLVSR